MVFSILDVVEWGEVLSKKQSACVVFSRFCLFFFLWKEVCTCFSDFRGVTIVSGMVRAVEQSLVAADPHERGKLPCF